MLMLVEDIKVIVASVITIYAPVIYTRPCIMFWRRGYTLRGEVVGGWALEFPSFLGPVKWQPQTVRCIKGRSGA